MDKYLNLLTELPDDYLHIVTSYTNDNKSPYIEPVHLLRGLLHKSIGMSDFIENALDTDYFYLLDWTEVRLGQAPKSIYPMKEATLSPDAKSVVKEAKRIGELYGLDTFDFKILLASLVSPGVGFTAEQLKTMPLTSDQILEIISGSTRMDVSAATDIISNNGTTTFGNIGKEANAVSQYCRSLTEAVIPHDIIGFEEKIMSMFETLSRKDKANVIVIGETGVGKTSLIFGLVKAVRNNKIPSALQNIGLFELDLISLSQGVTYKGEVEDRFKKICDDLRRHNYPVLLIENFQRIMDKQSVLNGVLPLLKRLLSQNDVQILLTSSIEGYTKDIEKDKELISYFEKITVEEPSQEIASVILENKMPSYEEYHGISSAEGVAEEIVRLAKRYMPEKCLPSSAIDLLDRAMASLKIRRERNIKDGSEVLTRDYVKDVVAIMTGLPIGNIQSEEREKLSNAEEIIHKRLVGQNHAVKSVLDAIYESRSGLNKKGQPIGSFFFLGPTGTGKTELAKALAEFLFNDETSILRFDMSEYKEEHSVALLYGAPPGYVGYEEGGLLVNQIRQHPYSVVLFDEIEKAHRSVFDLFLQILDAGKLHDRLGRVGDFSNALIIFTSNIGSDYIFKSFENNHVPNHEEMLEVMQGQFRPEFLARITEILPFSPITGEMIDKIFDIHIRGVRKSLETQGVELEIAESARQYITKVGFNTHYGARPVLGIIRKEIRRPLSKMIVAGDIEPGHKVLMKYDSQNKEMVWEIED